MKKLVVLAAGLALALSATIALAATKWPSVRVTPTITPDKAGTRAHPQSVKLKTVFHWATLGEASQPIVTQFHIWFPKGSLYNGAHTKSCSLRKIDQGPSSCPKGSIEGSGKGTAYADTTSTHPKIIVVNGGAKTIYFYTELNNPARVYEPVIGHLKKLSGKWAYYLTVTVPNNLRIVAGVPIELTYLTVTAGKGKWLETTGCDGGHWPYKVTTDYENPNTGATGSATDSSSAACHK